MGKSSGSSVGVSSDGMYQPGIIAVLGLPPSTLPLQSGLCPRRLSLHFLTLVLVCRTLKLVTVVHLWLASFFVLEDDADGPASSLTVDPLCSSLINL